MTFLTLHQSSLWLTDSAIVYLVYSQHRLNRYLYKTDTSIKRTPRVYTTSSPPFFLRDSRASETRAHVKITPREKRRHAVGKEKNESFFSLPAACRLFSHGVIFTCAHVSLALLSLRKNGGLVVVYPELVPAFLYSLYLTLYKTDFTLKTDT